MKKVLVVLTLILCVMMIPSCKSGPKPQDDTDKAFSKVYGQYSGNLILDGATTYTVVSGDRLSAIANQVYGNGSYFPIIMLASKDVVLDPDKIQPGMKLTVPVLQKNLDDSKAKGKIKSYLNDIAKIYDGRSESWASGTAKGLRDLSDTL